MGRTGWLGHDGTLQGRDNMWAELTGLYVSGQDWTLHGLDWTARGAVTAIYSSLSVLPA